MEVNEWICASDEIERVEEYLQQNPSLLEQKDENGNTLIHLAAQRNNVKMVKYLLEKMAERVQQKTQTKAAFDAVLFDWKGTLSAKGEGKKEGEGEVKQMTKHERCELALAKISEELHACGWTGNFQSIYHEVCDLWEKKKQETGDVVDKGRLLSDSLKRIPHLRDNQLEIDRLVTYFLEEVRGTYTSSIHIIYGYPYPDTPHTQNTSTKKKE